MHRTIFWKAAYELKGSEFKIFGVIAMLEDNDAGYCFATNKGIANKINATERTVTRLISSLKDKKYLFTIEIGKAGNHVDERRIYTADNYQNYLKDEEKKELIPTQYEMIEGVAIFYNEDNPKPEKDCTKESIDNFVHRGIDKTDYRGGDKTVYGNVSKLNTSKSNRNTQASLKNKISLKSITKISTQDKPTNSVESSLEKERNTLIGKIIFKEKLFGKHNNLENLSIEELKERARIASI